MSATKSNAEQQCVIHDDTGQRCPKASTHEVEDINGFTLHTCEPHARQQEIETSGYRWFQFQMRGVLR